MINDPTGELEDDNPIEGDYEAYDEDDDETCLNCGEPLKRYNKLFCSEDCEWEYDALNNK